MSKTKFGLALDLGTTTIKAALVNLANGKIKRRTTIFNPQNCLGYDVMTRINIALRGNYSKLRNLLLSGINEVRELLKFPSGGPQAIVGNPVMLSFYLNQPVLELSRYPFRSEITEGRFLKNPSRYVFPIIGGFVGGDTIAGILSSGIDQQPGIFLYIDLGTNGEIALITKEKILALSAAAGPAFEGVGISCGSLAVSGAIDRIIYKHGFRYQTIKKKKPIGICASGLIDLLAILTSLGWLKPNGRLIRKVALPTPLTITQSDIRKLQLAISAIHTGVEILLKKIGVVPEQITEAILTGELGASLFRNSLIRIGLLPKGIKQLRFEKDLPLKGAIKVLIDKNAIKQVEAIKRKSEHIELANEPDFSQLFIANLRLAPW
uniref:DUF4445 domain-containing protein n=1 Tax=candidate division WOR-3 bacterium TaxID=2052148 RepID=A0A7C6EDI7_UNCW3